MMQQLWQWDLSALHFVNVTMADPRLDAFWLGITQLHKQPLFLFGLLPLLLLAALYKYRLSAFGMLFALALTIALTDGISYRFLKSQVQRERPFQNVAIASTVRQVGEAHGSSFPSNHAANCFAAAVILAWYFPRRRYWFYLFATLVALSRVALGVHYPSDVIGGALLGIAIALVIRRWLLNRYTCFWLRRSRQVDSTALFDWRTRQRRSDES